MCKGKTKCEADLSKDGNYKIEAFVGGDKVLKLNLDVYKKPVIVFENDNGFSGHYGFDEASFQKLQQAGDYEKLTFNDTDYYVPFMTLQPGQQIMIKFDAKGLPARANKDKDFKVTIRSTDANVTIDGQEQISIPYNQLKGKIPIFVQAPSTNNQSDLNSPQYLIAEDHKGDEIGKIAFTYGQPVRTNQIVFVYVDHGSGYSSKSTNDILNYLNLKSHNQFFRKWDVQDIDSLNISTEYKKSSSVYTSSKTVLDSLKSNYSRSNNIQAGIYYFFITDLSVTKNGMDKVGGQAYVNGYFGASYNGADNEAIAHEFGHLLRLKHTFDSSLGNRQIPKGTTKNYMDYISGGRNMFFLYQIKSVK